jgi:indole-3-glycerol phosphate synthase
VANILKKIVARKREEIAEAKSRCSADELKSRLSEAPPVRDFVGALREAEGMGLIAEVKKASPSAGIIREDFHPVEIAKTYAEHGASCISVLTDEHFFQGHLDYLVEIRRAIDQPVLRKDFLLDPYQVVEARSAGADCVLLIAECLDDGSLHELYEEALKLGMSALVELYEPENLKRVLKLNPPMIGINNRNLKTFVTDFEHTIRLRSQIPSDCLVISESGIRTREDVQKLASAGVGGILVGETLMRSESIGDKIRELLGR